jgi:SAM-dependent methyltransferase
MTAPHDLSVWAVAQTPSRIQRRGRYVRESSAHPGKMLPALAATIIDRYTRPGEMVLDPMCGTGTTLVEAIHLGRRAIGVELEPRWAALAAANVTHARRQGAPERALVLQDDARRLGHGLLDSIEPAPVLILTSPPYGPSTHGLVHVRSHELAKTDWRYGRSRANLAHLPSRRVFAGTRRPRFLDALAEILTGCRRVLHPDGRVVITARAYRRHGKLIDLPGQLIATASDAGLRLHARHVALLCGLRGEGFVPRVSFFQLHNHRAGMFPRTLPIAHEDVLVFAASTPKRAARSARREPSPIRAHEST